MMKKISALIIVWLLFSFKLYTNDTTWIQTFTFDDITKRRGIFKFPDNTDNYRKILMYYTLKCDPKTAHDIYECGEWDYLAHCIIHQHTGIFDSTIVIKPKYNFGKDFPAVLKYTKLPTYNRYIKSYKAVTPTQNNQDIEHILIDGNQIITLKNVPTKIQFLFTKDFLKNLGLLSKRFKASKIKFIDSNFTLKNFKIQYILSSSKTIDELITGKFNTVFENNYYVKNPGWHTFYFNEYINTTSLQGLIIQICYDEIIGADEVKLSASEGLDCIIAQGHDSYLSFDGKYDYTISNNIDKLKNSNKFTIEFKAKLNSWLANGYIFSLNDILDFRTVEEYRQPKRYYINFRDSLSYGIYVGGSVNYNSEWQHFALVFDASKDQYDGKIKLFINGFEVPGFIRGLFPNAIPNKEIILKLAMDNTNYKCDLDEFRIWSSNLNQQTIQN